MSEDGSDILFPIRLNRYIAKCGEASRRHADELISSGRVAVDGAVVNSLGYTLAAPAKVEVDGREISPARHVYIVMNKPRGVVSAVSDERERTVIDLLPAHYRGRGVFPVGRLDLDSTGLIILTNDGDFANSILHPSRGIMRTYEARLRDPMDDETLERWRSGVEIDGKIAVPIKVERVENVVKYHKGDRRDLRIVLGEGFKREIRRMADALGNRVIRLKRIGFGKIFLENLPNGAFCEYNHDELAIMILEGGRV